MKKSGEGKEDDTWKLAEVFVEDTRTSTWPPRSYTCSFRRREFKSAQALVGHMNVHRRDRAVQLHQAQIQATASRNDPFGRSTDSITAFPSHPVLNWANNHVGFCSVGRNQGLSLYYYDTLNNNHNHNIISNFGVNDDQMQVDEELDLELRLGNMNAKIN